MIFGFPAGRRRWAGAVALTLLVALLISACGSSSRAPSSGGGSSAVSGRLTTAAGIKAAANAWVGHLVSYVAEDPTTLGKVETGFALQADKGLLAFNQSRGAPENQYQPTGNVDWVAIPPQTPTLSEVARIETNFKPISGSSQPAGSEDSLVLLARRSTQSRWLISNWADFNNPSPTILNQVRTLRGPMSAADAARLPIPAQGLPNAYLSYLGGGDNSKFVPGQYTDQSRNNFEAAQAGWTAVGVSFAYGYLQGSVQGVYSLGGGDALVFFGLVYSNEFQASPDTCLQQISSREQFPSVVPAGRYQSITLQNMASEVAIEDLHGGNVSVIASMAFAPTKATTSPTTAPACL